MLVWQALMSLDGERFKIALGHVAGKRLTFKDVTGKVEATPF
jgi:hypothetical protein